MIKIVSIFILLLSQSIAFSQIKIDGDWYVYDKGHPAEINDYEKDSLTHGYENIDFILGFSEQFTLTKNKKTYKVPEDELICTEQLLFEDHQVQNMAKCKGIEDENYKIYGGKHGIYNWINKKTITLSFVVGIGQFRCVYKIKEKEKELIFNMKGNVEFKKLNE
ncbi:hypothetical protein ERX46_10735 [Brumimicrobium glaciale]|uniref:Lipocalin-like domain-containing protein n=1 Tax=Brumimicrobium glaciale TaxID=200475 RepID=A0A4Q4KKB2_9FLAO|nr:hypothetical protein [Brumimicrobium glaciale]RYM33408.1 hypothetical protein ERX46_10735 [Brumimicrobium glaciale]